MEKRATVLLERGMSPAMKQGRTKGAVADNCERTACARTELADYEVPQRIRFIPQMPKGPTGKLDLSALKPRHASEQTGGSLCP
jgi:acyl-CoA synthetase (AMP-forming)/AMP-acid ligase II